MDVSFTRINTAIYWTLKFYDEFVPDFFLNLSGLDLDNKTGLLQTYYEHVFWLHEEMDKEINQSMYICIDYTKASLLEMLERWLSDIRIKEVNKQLIIDKINSYNARIELEFREKYEKEDDLFRQHPFYSSKKHLDTYTVEYSFSPFNFAGIYQTPKSVEEVYKKFYCIDETPLFLDTVYLDQYSNLVEGVLNNFRQVIFKYLAKYKAGYIFNNQSPVKEIQTPSSSRAALPASNTNTTKIKWTASPKAFVKTFNPLIKEGILELNDRSEVEAVVKMLYNLFEIDKTKGKGTLSLSSLITYFKKENADEPY